MPSNTSAAMTNKTAIITGASRGLGRNTAINLARRGVDVIFTYHSNQKEAETLVREVEAIGRKAASSAWIPETCEHSMGSLTMFAKRCKAGEGTGLTTS